MFKYLKIKVTFAHRVWKTVQNISSTVCYLFADHQMIKPHKTSGLDVMYCLKCYKHD